MVAMLFYIPQKYLNKSCIFSTTYYITKQFQDPILIVTSVAVTSQFRACHVVTAE
jgi:hypothetical protein